MNLGIIVSILKSNKRSMDCNIDEINLYWETLKSRLSLSDEELKWNMLNLIDSLSKGFINKTAEYKTLESKYKEQEVEIEALKRNPNAPGNIIQRDKLANGIKIASKPLASKEVIEQLKARGMSIQEIADMLKVSRATIWRRLKE